MSEAYPYPRVGCCIWIRKNGKALLGYRTWKHAPNTWAPPGGKVEMYEKVETCAQRETFEETGVRVKNIRLMTFTEDFYKETGQHYITLHYVADWKSGEAQLKEPEKFAEWRWFPWNKLPKPLLKSTRNFVKTGYNPFTI